MFGVVARQVPDGLDLWTLDWVLARHTGVSSLDTAKKRQAHTSQKRARESEPRPLTTGVTSDPRPAQRTEQLQRLQSRVARPIKPSPFTHYRLRSTNPGAPSTTQNYSRIS